MQIPTEEELILYYYDEHPDPESVRDRLHGSESSRQAYEELGELLETVSAAPVPDPGEDYEARLRQVLEARIAEAMTTGEISAERVDVETGSARQPESRSWRLLALAATFLVSITAAYMLGRAVGPDTDSDSMPVRIAEEAQTPRPENRVLLLSVAQHLEQTSHLLVHLSNYQPDGDSGIEIDTEVERATTLLASNRLYRQAARRSDQVAIEALLERLERLLIELARGPSRLEASELEHLRAELGAEALLFEVRVLGAELRQRRSAFEARRTGETPVRRAAPEQI